MQVWEKQLQQTQKAWKALRNRLDGVIVEAERQRRQQQQQQEAAASSPMGVKGLAAARAQSRQVCHGAVQRTVAAKLLGCLQPRLAAAITVCTRSLLSKPLKHRITSDSCAG